MYMSSNVIPLGWNVMLNQYVLLQSWRLCIIAKNTIPGLRFSDDFVNQHGSVL